MPTDPDSDFGNLIFVSVCSGVQLVVYAGCIVWALRRRTLFVVRRWIISLLSGVDFGFGILLFMIVSSLGSSRSSNSFTLMVLSTLAFIMPFVFIVTLGTYSKFSAQIVEKIWKSQSPITYIDDNLE
jgi:ABC-type spermidine/putrescine transport system permease subunit II